MEEHGDPPHPAEPVDDEDEGGDEDDRPTPVYPSRTGGSWLGGGLGQSSVIVKPKGSTPLESAEPDPVIPPAPLWSMKYLRHARSDLSSDDENGQVRWASSTGEGDDRLYAIDDGWEHCMVARPVGAAPDGCTYCLVARVPRLDFEEVRAGWSEPADLLAVGTGFTLCGVAEGAVSNVFRAAAYRKYKDVPTEFLPPAEFIAFDELL
jgi:hypothetical protein